MEQRETPLNFEIAQVSPNFCKATVTISSDIVDKAYEQALKAQKASVNPYGFHHDDIPLEYIKQNFENNINHHLEEFLFKHFILGFLYQKIHDEKINTAGDPRLTYIQVTPGKDAIFNFDMSLFPKIEFQNWKYYPFRAPKRKKLQRP